MKRLFATVVLMMASLVALPTWAGWQNAPTQTAMLGSRWHPSGLFVAGQDSNGAPFFLCRAYYSGSWVPGKTWPGYPNCNIPYGGREIIMHNFQVYYGQPQGYWQHARGGAIPYHALVVGRDTNGNTLYLCHGRYANSIIPGKTWAGYSHCNVPYGGREVLLYNYAIYVTGTHHWYRHHHHHHHHYPARSCVSNSFGQHACGYNCVTSPTSVACASSPNENCVVDPFGNTRCGHDCRINQFQQIVCG